MSKKWYVILIISIVLNLVAAGFAGGRLLHKNMDTHPPMPHPNGVKNIESNLEMEDRRAIMRTLRDIRREGHSADQAIKTARENVVSILNQPDASEAQIFQALVAMTQAEATLRTKEQARLAAYLATLSADERAFVSKVMARSSGRRGNRQRPPPKHRDGQRPPPQDR